MRLRVLIDNNTLIDRYFIGEPGVCYHIEVDGKKLLFDLGYSNAFIQNAIKMGIDLKDLDFIVISHSHLDHTWGMEPLIKLFNEVKMEGGTYKRPVLIGHPEIFVSRSYNGEDEFGMNMDREKVTRYMDAGMSRNPVWLTDKLVFLGEIPRLNDFEALQSIGRITVDDVSVEDYSRDDSALCYKSKNGLVIITGCSHSGICNIMAYARKICDDTRIVDVIGGFHLMDPIEQQMKGTVNYFESLGIKAIHACHCTDLKSKVRLAEVVDVVEVGVGLELIFD